MHRTTRRNGETRKMKSPLPGTTGTSGRTSTTFSDRGAGARLASGSPVSPLYGDGRTHLPSSAIEQNASVASLWLLVALVPLVAR